MLCVVIDIKPNAVRLYNNTIYYIVVCSAIHSTNKPITSYLPSESLCLFSRHAKGANVLQNDRLTEIAVLQFSCGLPSVLLCRCLLSESRLANGILGILNLLFLQEIDTPKVIEMPYNGV